ncbi:hypothetical protein Emed_001020 [Eimeria media]
MRAPWARHFSDGLEKIMPIITLSQGPLVKSSEKGHKSRKVIASTTGQGIQGVKQLSDASDASEIKLYASFLVHAAFCFEDGGKRAKAQKWVVAIEVALSRLSGAASLPATSAGSLKDHTNASKGDTGGTELMKAWAVLEPKLPQVVEAAFIVTGAMPQVDGQLQRLLQSIEFDKDFGENDHFAAYLLAKAALAQRLWLLARTMAHALSRWHSGSSGAVMLQGILEIETGLYLQEYLHDVQLKDSMSFAPSAPLTMLVPSNKELSPIAELRIKAMRRLEESLMAVEHLNVNGDLVEICVATMWNIARPCLCPAFRRQVFRSLHRTNSALIPDITQKADQASSNLLRNNASANPVLAASCALEADGSVEAAEWPPQSLFWCLERMREQNSAFTTENSNAVDQLQQLALRSKHEKFLTNVCEHAKSLTSRALAQLEEEELRRDARQQPLQHVNSGKRTMANAHQSRASLVKTKTLSWKTEKEVKRIISSFSCLLKRALELEDFTTAARAATAVLSLVHGTEECLESQNSNVSPLVASYSVDLRVRLRPPLETEVAIDIIHASYSLVSLRIQLFARAWREQEFLAKKHKLPATNQMSTETLSQPKNQSPLQKEEILGIFLPQMQEEITKRKTSPIFYYMVYDSAEKLTPDILVLLQLEACTYGREAGCSKLLLFAAKALWQAAIPMLSDEMDADEACSAVKAALYTIPPSCRSASAGLITHMCMGLLWSLRKNKQWDQLLRMAEAAVLLTPKALHGVFMKLQILALTCKGAPDLFQSVCVIAQGEPFSEASLLLFFARLSFDNSTTALEPYEKALELFRADGDPQAIFVHMELAERLITMRRPWVKACAHIKAATDLLREWTKLPELVFEANHPEQENSSEVDQKAGHPSVVDVAASPIKLQDLLLLHAQIFQMLYSPNSADAIGAARDVVRLSTQILGISKARFSETNAVEQECQVAPESRVDAASTVDKNEKQTLHNFEQQEAARLCQPVSLKVTRKLGSIAEACKAAGSEQLSADPSRGRAASSAVNAACQQEQSAPAQHTLLWSINLALAFRSLSLAESYFFDLGLEYWALLLVRLRARITEAFLSLSFSSGKAASCVDSSGCMHPAVALLQASLNMQVCRAALACQCLDEAKILLPLFSPPILRNLLTKLDKATQGEEGYSNALGRQARSLSVVTGERISCLVPLTQLLLTLGEQCLLIGEVDLASQLGQAAHRYMGTVSEFTNRTASLYVRQIALLAWSRLRQGDQDGALQLVQRVLQTVQISSLDIQAATHLVEILWKAHASKGTVTQAMPLVRKVEQSLSELIAANSTTIGFDRSTHKLTGFHAASSRRQASMAAISASRREKASKAAGLPGGAHQSRAGRGATSVDSYQWPLILAACRHQLKKLQLEHLFSLYCLGWTTEGGALQNDWKEVFLGAMDAISSLLDRSDNIRVILKPLQACALTCLRGVRFLTAAMQFLWVYPANFLEYRWESRKGPPAVRDGCRKAPLVTPSDLKECVERLHRVLAGLDLESKSILNFISDVEGSQAPYQSALLWADMIAIASAQLCPWTQDEPTWRENKEMCIEDLRSALVLVDKSGKGLQRSLSQLTSVGMRDSAVSVNCSIASHELEGAFSACIAGGSLHEATVLGDVLISGVLGNKLPENLERLFAAITTLQAAQVARIAKLLQLQYMNPQMAECVAVHELRLLEDLHQQARILPQFQALNA